MHLALAIVAVVVAAGLTLKTGSAFRIDRTRPLVAPLDGYAYRVHVRHIQPTAAADRLARIHARIIELLRNMRKKYVRRPGSTRSVRTQATHRLLSRYNPDNLAENSPRDPAGDTSYTLDKGAVLALCLRSAPPPHGLLDLNLLVFVAVHELAHVAVDVHGHPPEFWVVFKWLLGEAAEAGIYRPDDYGRRPLKFCGLQVDYQPLFDPQIPPFE